MSAPDSSGFTHLHLHSQYSLLDGAIRLADLVPMVKEKGMTSVAVTDHGNMFGAIDFYKTAKKHGVKPIMGCEAYVAGSKGRHDRTDRSSAHMVLLAKDNEGYKNLSYLISMGFMEGFYYNPRIDLELLKKHSKGLYATSACLGGVINKTLWRDGESAAAAYAKELKEVFEPGHFFLELQNNGYEQQVQANTFLMNVAEMYDIPLVATADAHYLQPKDSAAHEILMCIKENKSLGEFRSKFKHSDELYVKSPEQMHQAFAKICPQAVENAAMIARNCNVELDLSTVYMPKFPIPEGFDLNSYLEHTAMAGLERRISEARYPIDRAAYKQRLDYELGVIIKMNFAGYFLVVWDFIRYAKEQTIPVGPGRGSGAGSLVAFCLRITDLDPIPHDLLFERFLNPERKSMPDFDVDFCQDRRGEVINYVTKKYGEKNVGQIVTYAQLSAKGVIKDVARVMEVPFQEVNELTKLIPALVNGKKVSIDQALELEPKLRQIQDEKPIYKEIINVARALEGLNRNTGTHAAGVVIGDKPLWEYVPVLRGKEGEIITQFAKDEVELAGLIKFDFLGLKTLTVIANAVKHVRQIQPDFNADNLPLDDAKVYQLIAAADTDGVFQLESSGFKELLKRLKPDRFEDIVAAVALYRPGPLDAGMVDDYIARKHGKKKVEYPHPSCEEILQPTYGVIVYQEQVMRIAVALSGFTMGESDTLRKAMGKKKADVMAEQRAKFVDGAVDKSGMNRTAADELFTQIEKFAGYAFNKCIVADTRIMDARTGEVTTVGHLYANPRKLDIHALTDDWTLTPRKVSAVVYNGRKATFELRTRQGKKIVATDNHPFRTLDGWRNLGELRVGDRIATPRALRVETARTWPRHEVIALAHLLAEGNTCHPSALYFTGKEPAAIADFTRAVEQFPHTTARTTLRDNGCNVVAATTGRDTRWKPGQVPWNARSQSNVALAEPLAEEIPSRSGAYVWAQGLGILGKTATEKSVPGAVFALCDADIALFLGRLWSGDGFIANATQAVPFYATSSEQLARDVQLLLVRLGITSGVHYKEFKYRGTLRPGYTVHVVGDGARTRFLELVTPHCVARDAAVATLANDLASKRGDATSKDTIPGEVRAWVAEERKRLGLTWDALQAACGISMKEFTGLGSKAKRGFRRSTVARLAMFFTSTRLQALSRSDVFWDEVVAIEPRGVQDTFDLTVDGDHNFVADGIVVHNSHSAAYAVVTYQTAYLKTYFPVEFTAALLSTEMGVQDNVVRYISSAKQHGIQVLPPDVNVSERDFTVMREANGKHRILFGLGAVKGIGDSAIEGIIDGRAGGKAYTSLFDLCERVSSRKMNRKVLEALAKSGSFDQFGKPREVLLGALDKAIELGQSVQKDRESGQTNLFAAFAQTASPAVKMTTGESYPSVPEWSEKQKLTAEKEALGFFVSSHPLDSYADDLPRIATTTTSNLATLAESRDVRFGGKGISIAGIITQFRERPLKSGDGRMAFLTIEDLTGSAEVLVFSKVYAEYEQLLKGDDPVLITGAVMVDFGGGKDADETEAGGAVKLRAQSVELLSEARAKKTKRFELAIPVFAMTDDKLVRLRELLVQNRGDVQARLTITQANLFETVIVLPETMKVNPTEELLVRVDKLFGQKVVKLA